MLGDVTKLTVSPVLDELSVNVSELLVPFPINVIGVEPSVEKATCPLETPEASTVE